MTYLSGLVRKWLVLSVKTVPQPYIINTNRPILCHYCLTNLWLVCFDASKYSMTRAPALCSVPSHSTPSFCLLPNTDTLTGNGTLKPYLSDIWDGHPDHALSLIQFSSRVPSHASFRTSWPQLNLARTGAF